MEADSGPNFEKKALQIARAIHDPLGQQGAMMLDGRERDGVFIDSSSITVYEFTTLRTKAKAAHDGEKIAQALSTLSAREGNRFKSRTGYFVTDEEPTADQRAEIDRISRAHNQTIFAISSTVLRKKLFDSAAYIRNRDLAPFGSLGRQIAHRPQEGESPRYVEQRFKLDSAEEGSAGVLKISDLVDRLRVGSRIIIVGDYGSGKSEALYQLYLELRKKFFRRELTERVPMHINLRELYGCRFSSEILARHSEEIGYGASNELVSAWRAGSCTLLLDGFDELIPHRWIGGARDLKGVRREALSPIRRLIQDMDTNCGVCIAGRAQYFSSADELREALGLKDAEVVEVEEIDYNQVAQLVAEAKVDVPDWAPMKPLILKLLADYGYLQSGPREAVDEGQAWLRLLDDISQRESDQVNSVRPENVRRLLARTATISRIRGDGVVTDLDLREAFTAVCGYAPEDDGMQLIMRLPGLTSATKTSWRGQGEVRAFADTSLSDAAFGIDLSDYVNAPFDKGHPMAGDERWNSATSSLVAKVAAARLRGEGHSGSVVNGALNERARAEKFDGVTLDLALTGDELEGDPKNTYAHVRDVLAETLVVSGGDYVGTAHFTECMIDTLDVSIWDSGQEFPTFTDCYIGTVVGWNSIPAELEAHFQDTPIDLFSDSTVTNDGILALGLDARASVVLTILRKVYVQRGSGRRYSALTRGIPDGSVGYVHECVDALCRAGYLRVVSGKSDGIYGPVKGQRSTIERVLVNPVAREEFLEALSI